MLSPKRRWLEDEEGGKKKRRMEDGKSEGEGGGDISDVLVC